MLRLWLRLNSVGISPHMSCISAAKALMQKAMEVTET